MVYKLKFKKKPNGSNGANLTVNNIIVGSYHLSPFDNVYKIQSYLPGLKMEKIKFKNQTECKAALVKHTNKWFKVINEN